MSETKGRRRNIAGDITELVALGVLAVTATIFRGWPWGVWTVSGYILVLAMASRISDAVRHRRPTAAKAPTCFGFERPTPTRKIVEPAEAESLLA